MDQIGGKIAFIPLRSGSKGVRGKNHKIIAGKALFQHSLDACLNSRLFDRIVVATDSERIKSIVNENYSDIDSVLIYNRSKENAQDISSTESVMMEFSEKFDFDHIILVQATSPLTTSEDFNLAWEKYKRLGLDSLLTVVNEKRFYWEEKDDGSAKALNYNPLTRPRRQDFTGSLVENGAFYITSKRALMKSGCRLSGKIGIHVMAPETAIEIDELSDFDVVESLIYKRVRGK